MKKEHVVLNFIRIPVVLKIEIGRLVYGKMNGHPQFINPDVSLEELKAKTDLLEERKLEASDGGRTATSSMRDAALEWDNTMRKIARYVDRIADGNPTMILETGFSLTKQLSSTGKDVFKVKQGDRSGSVSLRHKRIAGAKSYIWQYCIGEIPGNESDWVTVQVTTRASAELTGLTPLTIYWFRVAAVTPSGTTSFCSPKMLAVI